MAYIYERREGSSKHGKTNLKEMIVESYNAANQISNIDYK
jgi:hypothetical protein